MGKAKAPIAVEDDLWQERLSASELKLVRALIHTLDEDQRRQRALITKREMRVDQRWGFFGGPLWRPRQFVYRYFVHRFLRK